MFLSISDIGFPSNNISPLHCLYSPDTNFEIVDLPQPDGPTKATLLPGFNFKLKSSIKGASNFEYPKETFFSSTSPDNFLYCVS